MKQGKQDLAALATEIVRQQNSKKDFIAPSNLLRMQAVGEDGPKSVTLGTKQGLPLRDYAHGQIANRLGIPKQYYDRMKADAPVLLASNVNEWLSRSNEKRMLRTMDGHIRAVLSDKFSPLDNYDLLEAVLPAIQETECKIVSCEVTETKLYIKAITEKVTADISKGDIVQAGLVISNSEVGAGAVSVEPLVYRLVCLNGMIAAEAAMRRNHVGRRLGSDDDANSKFYSLETRRTDAKAFFMKVKDTVRGVLSTEGFGQLVRGMKALKDFRAAESTDPKQVIEDVTDKLRLTDVESSGVLKHLIEGGDLSGYGLMNAVTRTSQDIQDYDRATEMERFGGMMCGWSIADWKMVGMVR